MKNFPPGLLAGARRSFVRPLALLLSIPSFLGAVAQAQTTPTGSRAYSWGYNLQGRLGDGTTITRTVPVAVERSGVLSDKAVSQISTGSFFGLALTSDGTLVSWGNNSNGELGNGGNTNSSIPVLVDRSGVLSGKTITKIASGRLHSMALASDGTLVSWGFNGNGELGNGGTASSNVPVAVDRTGVLAGKTVVQMAAGVTHSLALTSDGTVVAWGRNVNGELGDGTNVTSRVPVLVDRSGVLAGKTVVQVAAGANHSLVLTSDGILATWGKNANGELGNGTTVTSRVPVLVNRSGVLAGKTVTQIAAGAFHNLVLTGDGIVSSWGANSGGGLGNNSTTNSRVPVLVNRTGVLSGKTVTQISAGAYHSLALRNDGLAVSWGYNVHGELGNESTTSSRVPVLVNRTPNVSAISGQIVWQLGRGSSSFHSHALAYTNRAPIVTSVSITRNAPTTNEVVTATPVANDPDGSPLTYSYVWRKNGVVLSGETGPTLNLSVAGNGDRGDTISVTVVASDGFSFSAPASDSVVVNAVPVSESATPSSGTSDSSVARSISVVYSDADGTGDIAQARLLVGSSREAVNAFYAFYDALANKLFLTNDAGTKLVGGFAPGSAASISNSAGSLNCAATTVVREGNTLTVNWNFTPNGFFTGAKTVYGYVRDRANATQGLRALGTLTVALNAGNDKPLVQSLSPATGTSQSSTARTLSFTYGDPDGQADIAQARIVIGANALKERSLYGFYDAVANKLFLYDDTGTKLLGGFAPGSPNRIGNTQGHLNCAQTTVSRSGDSLTVNWNFTPNGLFVGPKRVYGFVRDRAQTFDGFRSFGTWNIVKNSVNDAPINRSVNPAAATGSVDQSQLLRASYSDVDGTSDIRDARILVNNRLSADNSLYGLYNRAQNKLYLYDDAGTRLLGGFAPGSANTISNSQGTLNCAATTVSTSGSVLVVGWSFTPKAAFAGNKLVYLRVFDVANASDDFDRMGTWNIGTSAPVSPAGNATAPSSGAS